jgi:hypothetical protein
MAKRWREIALALGFFIGSMVACAALAHAGVILVVMP